MMGEKDMLGMNSKKIQEQMSVLQNAIIQLQDTNNKIYDHVLDLTKLVNVVSDHERRINQLERKQDKTDMFITEYLTKDCKPIKETDNISFEDIAEVLQRGGE